MDSSQTLCARASPAAQRLPTEVNVILVSMNFSLETRDEVAPALDFNGSQHLSGELTNLGTVILRENYVECHSHRPQLT